MDSDNLKSKNKALLFEKLKAAKKVVEEIVSEYLLKENDKIGTLFLNLSQKIEKFKSLKDKAIRRNDFLNRFIYEIEYNHYNHLQNIINLITLEDFHTFDDTIDWLLRSINWRLEDFDNYWDMLEKGEIKNPYLDR